MSPPDLSEGKRRLLALYLKGDQAPRKDGPTIIPRLADPLGPLSSEQELIWIHSHLAPELPLYNEILTVRRTGPLDVPALERALSEIVRRHQAWRTTFKTVEGAAVEVIGPPPQFALPVIDLRRLPEAEREPEALRLATEEARRPLDLVNGPLVRATLVRMAEAEYRVYVVVHQILHDGVSVYSVFLPELVTLYEAFAAGKPSPLSELPVQYPDYARWQRQQLREHARVASLDYWRRQLAGAPTALELPTDRARPTVQSFRGRQETFALSKSLTEALKRLSQREEATLFVTLLAAFKVLLHRYTGQEDIVVGTAISTRKRPEVEKLLGVFLNTIVLRTRIEEGLSFRKLLGRVREVALEGISHGDVPFHLLVKELQPQRDPGRNPLFQVTFVLEPPMPAPRPDWELTQMDAGTGVARVDLYLQMDDRPEGLVGHIRYSADLWQPSTITRLVEHFQLLLEGIVADPSRPVSAIPMLTPAERLGTTGDRIAPRPASSFIAFEAGEVEQSIPQRFAKQVAKHPDRIAVRDGRAEWTYAQLDQAANQVARALSAPQRVALLLNHEAPMVAAILGVLKAGGTYVPLDATHPTERLREIVADAGASTLLASEVNLPVARELAAAGVTLLEIDAVLRGPRATETGLEIAPDQLAYLLYTSGSTGRPKGVSQNHRNVLHFIAAYTNNLHLCADDRLTLVASSSVDAAVMDIFAALLNGATLCPIDVRAVGLSGVRDRLTRDGITIYHSTPTLYRHLVRDLSGRAKPETVRLVVLGGEEVRSEDVTALRENFGPSCMLVNGFGPTESTVSLQYFVDRATSLERRSVPIGHPVERTAVSLLSRDGRPGQVYGEIAIRSPHVAVGYWQDPELTDAVFLADPAGGKDRVYKTGDMGRLLPDGSLEFCGRSDQQTKIQGFRVEIGEIEAVLSRHPGVKEAAAAAMETSDGEKRVIAYFVADREPPSADEMRRFLRGRLPAHMIPFAFVRVEAMPLTASGKIDRRNLPAPERDRPEQKLTAPRDDLERRLTEIWKSVLGVESLGIGEDFFDLGGHSVLALGMMVEIERSLGVSLPLATLIEAPTVERLAEVLRVEVNARPARALVAIQPGGDFPPLFCVLPHSGEGSLYREVSRLLGPKQPFFALATLEGQSRSIPEMVAANLDALYSVQPRGPYLLGGFGLGGVVAFEMAQQLLARDQQVALLALFPGPVRKAPLAQRVRRKLANLFEAALGTDKSYVARIYPGRMTVFGARLDPQLAGLTAAKVEMVELPGDLDSMIEEPFVRVLAERLDAVLNRAREGQRRRI